MLTVHIWYSKYRYYNFIYLKTIALCTYIVQYTNHYLGIRTYAVYLPARVQVCVLSISASVVTIFKLKSYNENANFFVLKHCRTFTENKISQLGINSKSVRILNATDYQFARDKRTLENKKQYNTYIYLRTT